MAISVKKCKGLWVTSLQNGKITGQIAGAVIDTKENKLVGFKVKPKRTQVLNKELWLPVENIKKIGLDMVLVANESKLLPEALTGFQYERLANMPVSSKDGRALGELVNISIDEKTWTLTEFELEGQLKVVIDIKETVLGEDIILIQSEAKPEPIKGTDKKEPKLKVEIAEDFSETTSKMVKQGEAFVKKTGEVVRKVLKGSEANLKRVREKLAETNSNNIADLSNKKKTKKDEEE